MAHDDNTTIAAISSPPGAGRRGVIRVSGPRSRDLVRGVWAGVGRELDLSRRSLHRGMFRDARGLQPLLLLWMPAPHSFTREDVAEFHLPGTVPLLAAALERLLALGAVPAVRGEFTRRAFTSGRIDLTRAEGVLALVEAHSDEERRASTALLFGGLAQRVRDARDALEDLRALCEAALDFDENDTGHVPASELERRRAAIARALERASGFEGERSIRATGIARVVLFGARNAGKSALFNALIGADRALVSDHAGTTRDPLGADLDRGGARFRLSDTAGLDADASGVDARAQDASRAARDAADLVLWVVECAREDDGALAAERRALPPSAPFVLVRSKLDLRCGSAASKLPSAESGALVRLNTSAVSGAGVDELSHAIAAFVERQSEHGGAGLLRELALRHRRALELSLAEIERGFASWRAGAALEILAEHLRDATAALDEITGRTTPEDILDRLFARFCLGK